MLPGLKIYHLTMIYFFYFLCVLVTILSLFGCNQASKHISPESALVNGDVTLLWNKIPGAISYNVYVSKSPGVTKLSGYKIPNGTNSVKIDRLEPGNTYYFVVTVVDKSGESKESKELSYHVVADKIGLVYWEKLFEKPIQDHKTHTAEIRQDIKATPERIVPEPEAVAIKNEALSDKMAGVENASIDLAKENPTPSKKRVAETGNIGKGLTENTKPTTVSVETGTDHNVPVSDRVRLNAAQLLADSHFYIFFEQHSNELSPKAIEKLDRIYNIMTNNSGATLTLNGYTDSSGTPSFDQMVSEVRSSTVKSYLSGKGINPSRIMALGHGNQKALASNQSEEGRRLNRRVEIKLIIP